MAPWATADDPDAATALGLAIIGDGVRAGRNRARLSQRQLGWLVGLSQSAISRLETGSIQGLRLRTLARIVAELESRSDYVFPPGPPLRPWELIKALPTVNLADPADPGPAHDADGHRFEEVDSDDELWS